MRPTILALLAIAMGAAACERPNLGDDTSDTGDTADDTGDDTGDTDTSDTDTGLDTDSGDDSDTATIDTDGEDTDTDTGADTSDTDYAWDPLYLYPASTSCHDVLDNQWGVPPKADGTWAAGRFPADATDPMTVYQVRVVMRHGTDSEGQACDASGDFEMRLLVTNLSSPPNATATALRTKSFPAVTMGAETHRDLIYTLETPLVVPNTDFLWVAIDGHLPGSGAPSCWQACKTGNIVGGPTNQNWFTNEADPASWNWVELGQHGFNAEDDWVEYMMTVWYLE